MTVLEIIAETKLGPKTLTDHPILRAALRRTDNSARSHPNQVDRDRLSSIVELLSAYEQEPDSDERANILRTLEELSLNESLEVPVQTVDEWEATVGSKDPAFGEAKNALERRRRDFHKKYFSLRARAGLETQQDVARKAGIRRSYVAVIEAGLHLPKQKILQKLAKAFEVDVSDLIT